MICYVDDDILVYSDGDEPASLASRDYMQRLFSTGRKQVTDSFAAGADGVTLNYTVAVPLKDKNDNITGCLFCAIYFDEIVEILKDSSGTNNAETTLLGSQGQIMSSTEDLPYGDSIMDEFKKMTILEQQKTDWKKNFCLRNRAVTGASKGKPAVYGLPKG